MSALSAFTSSIWRRDRGGSIDPLGTQGGDNAVGGVRNRAVVQDDEIGVAPQGLDVELIHRANRAEVLSNDMISAASSLDQVASQTTGKPHVRGSVDED